MDRARPPGLFETCKTSRMAKVPWTSPTRPWEDCDPARQAALRQAWGSGHLKYKLDPSQAEIYDDIFRSHQTVQSSMERIYVLDISRQSGKDFLMATMAIEQAYRTKAPVRIPYAAPTRDNVHELLIPTFMNIFADCPPDMLPREMVKGSFARMNGPCLTWPWGARIVLVGVDLHPDWLRGPATYCCFFTEPAFVDNLEDVVEGVLLPQLLTRPDGFSVFGSTPPVTPGHAWSTKYVPQGKARGMYAKRVITECPRLPDEQIEGAIRQYGGMESTRCRRELFCEHIVDSVHAVCPEFTDAKKTIVDASTGANMPRYCDAYTVLDPGFNDGAGVVFAYYDFESDMVNVIGDLFLQGKNSAELALHVNAREWQLFGLKPRKPHKVKDDVWAECLDRMQGMFYPDLPIKAMPVEYAVSGAIHSGVYTRRSDTASQVIADLANEHGLLFSPTDKDDTDAAANSFRLKIQNGKYRIHPRCVHLIAQLEQATWNKSRTRLAPMPGGGHYDVYKAGEYLNRNIVWGRNPFPAPQYSRSKYHVPRGFGKNKSGTAAALNAAFGGKRY